MMTMGNYSLECKAVTSFVQYGADDGDLGSDNGDYVFEIDTSLDTSTLAVSISNNSIVVYDCTTFGALNKFLGHTDTINGLEFSKTSPQLVYSCSSDKSVCLWDIRTNNGGPMIKISYAEEVTSMSVGVSDSLLAAGVESSIIFHDIRGGSIVGNAKNYRKLGQYSDAHSDVITQLRFSKQHPEMLTSASEDGLLCVFNTSVAEQEEAVVSVLNSECPIRRFGYFGSNDEGIYALSTVETASIWHYPSAQRISHFGSIRDDLGMNYLVDCVYEAQSDTLSLLAGNYCGSAVMARLEPSGASVVAHLQSGSGHVSTIRCCSLLPGGKLLTGGEDSRLCRWGVSSVQSNSSGNRGTTHSGGSGLKAGKTTSSVSVRHRPY